MPKQLKVCEVQCIHVIPGNRSEVRVNEQFRLDLKYLWRRILKPALPNIEVYNVPPQES